LPSPAPVPAVSAVANSVSFNVFSAAPRGTLGDSYLRLANFAQEDRK
jgi:hypothetical protein